jgi:hypothetical protein
LKKFVHVVPKITSLQVMFSAVVYVDFTLRPLHLLEMRNVADVLEAHVSGLQTEDGGRMSSKRLKYYSLPHDAHIQDQNQLQQIKKH